MSILSKEQAREFANFLTYRTDRAALAELRRAAANAPGEDARSWRILGHLLADHPRVADAQLLTAALFALYAPGHWQPDNTLRLPRPASDERRHSFGASLRRLRQQLSVGHDSLDLRFAALLDTSREDLTVPLRGLVQRLTTAKKPVAVDFACLLRDLVYWDYDDPGRASVRRTWARDYWKPAAAEASDAEQPADQSNA